MRERRPAPPVFPSARRDTLQGTGKFAAKEGALPGAFKLLKIGQLRSSKGSAIHCVFLARWCV